MPQSALGSFVEAQPAPRVFGLESELGTQVGPRPREAQAFKAAWIEDLVRTENGVRMIGQFLSNGARLYLDVGQHVEYATPECQTLQDLVAADIAGQELLTRVLSRYNGKADVADRVYLNTRIIDSTSSTWGSHENYLINRDINPTEEDFYAPVVGHLATRPLFTGAGGILQTKKGPHFVLSQRADATMTEVSSSSTKARPFINTRDEPHADAQRYRRLHVIGGDPTMSPWATAVRFGSTSLVMRLREHGADLRKFHIKDPVRATRLVAADLTFQKPIELADGSTILPVEHQLALAELCLKLAKDIELPPDEIAVAQQWYDAAEALEEQKDPAVLEDKADWAKKRFLMNREAAKPDQEDTLENIKKIDFLWGELSARGLARIVRGNGGFRDFLGAMDVHEPYITGAPPGRAKLRGDAIAVIDRQGGKRPEATVGWDSVKVDGKLANLKNPFGTSQRERNKLQQVVSVAVAS